MKKILGIMSIVLAVGMFVNGCAQYEAAKGALGMGISVVKETRFNLANKAEELRCTRPIELMLKMADERGDAWFVSYLRSCPNVESYLRRIASILQPRPMLPPLSTNPMEFE